MITTLRQKWYRTQASGAMAQYLSAPLPSKRDDVLSLEFLALDLETTGLDSATDRIVSIGSVRIAGNRILGNSARHTLIRIDGSVQQSATIHRITDTDLDGAVTEREALDATLHELSGRVLLVHHAAMDFGFLNAACHRHYNTPLITRTVDTLDLARHIRERGNQQIKEGELRLHALRTAYGLPRYPAHNALSDAVATAELFLALLPRWAGQDALPLRTILS